MWSIDDFVVAAFQTLDPARAYFPATNIWLSEPNSMVLISTSFPADGDKSKGIGDVDQEPWSGIYGIWKAMRMQIARWKKEASIFFWGKKKREHRLIWLAWSLEERKEPDTRSEERAAFDVSIGKEWMWEEASLLH